MIISRNSKTFEKCERFECFWHFHKSESLHLSAIHSSTMKAYQLYVLSAVAVLFFSGLVFHVLIKEPETVHDFHHGYAFVVSNPHSMLPAVPTNIRAIIRRQELPNVTLSYMLGDGVGVLGSIGAPIFAVSALTWVVTRDSFISGVSFFPAIFACNYLNYKYLEYALSEELLTYEKEAEEERAARKDRDQKQAILREKQQSLWEKHVRENGDL